MRARDEPIRDPPCEMPAFIDNLYPALRIQIRHIWKNAQGKDECLVEIARTRTILQSLPLAERARLLKPPLQCEVPYDLKIYPRMIQRKIRQLWREQRGKKCLERHRGTRLFLLNLPSPTNYSPFRQPAAFLCSVPHFIDRLEEPLQEKLRAIWKDYKQGQECATRVENQLVLLQKNDISLHSFQMPPPSMFRRYVIANKLRRASVV